MKDKDFDKIIEIMKDEFQWRGEVGKDNFTYTNELIKATKLALGLGYTLEGIDTSIEEPPSNCTNSFFC